MKKNTMLKINIFVLVFMLLFGIVLVANNEQKTDIKVYADSAEQIQIENDGMVISSELWTALYTAYSNIKGEPNEPVLTLDMFKDFPVKILNLSTNAQGQSYGLNNITGLGEFDLSAFDTINLSGNNLTTIGEELINVTNLTSLDLSNNNIGTFKTEMLASACLSTLEVLNLSNNVISSCDLTGLQMTQIDLSDNRLTINSITFPQEDCVINLNNNNILEPNTDLVNVIYGYQGAKNKQTFEISTEILFLASSNLNYTKIEVYENDEIFDTLTDNEMLTLPIGNYTLKFLNDSNQEMQDAISFKVLLPKVTAKLFVNGEEIEYTSVLTEDTVIKFYGVDGAEIFSSTNSNVEKVSNIEYKITQNGIVIISAYQTKDGYSSNIQSFYFSVKKSTIGSWLIAGLGIVAIILLYYVFRFILNKIIYKSTKDTPKGKLD